MLNLTGREIIKTIMQQCNVTNAEMATRLGITQATVWERLNNTKTRDIPLSTFCEMLSVLNYEVQAVPTINTDTKTEKEGVYKVMATKGMKMKKWKICVGNCGPTFLWTNIIKAYTKEEAVRKYLAEDCETGDVDQSAVDDLVEHCYEYESQPRNKKKA